MLARRFTIVCLLVAIFGMSLSILVAESSRTGYAPREATLGCSLTNIARCAALPAR